LPILYELVFLFSFGKQYNYVGNLFVEQSTHKPYNHVDEVCCQQMVMTLIVWHYEYLMLVI